MSDTPQPSNSLPDSPLAELKANSLEEYFNRDPNLLQDKDIVVMCAEYRRKRVDWAQEEQAKKTGAKPKKQSISLKDLGLS